ncbi:MAG: hypothetical protein EXR69_15875, partial [Myxococcales bacterium]|nr:hypothetical protein [Myxococcales bacterium]
APPAAAPPSAAPPAAAPPAAAPPAAAPPVAAPPVAAPPAAAPPPTPVAAPPPAPAGPRPARSSVPPSLERDPSGLGIGAALGLPTGLSASWRPKLAGAWFQGGLGWDFSTGTLAVGGDVLYTLATLHAPDIQEFSFPVYVGAGPRFRLGTAVSAYAPPVVALRLPLGMCFYHEGVPVEGYFEMAPGIGFIPHSSSPADVRGTFDVVLGGRFYLPGL